MAGSGSAPIRVGEARSTCRGMSGTCSGAGDTSPLSAEAVPGVAVAEGSNRHLDPKLFDRVANRLVTKEDFEPGLAARATNEAFAFVEICATKGGPGMAFSPTAIVDEAWHAMILFTADYERLCTKLGKFVHHVPHDHVGQDDDGKEALRATVEMMKSLGVAFDAELWDFALKVDSGSNCCAQCSRCSAGSCRS